MKEFKYFIEKLEDTFLLNSLTFIKCKNAFNKLYKEFVKKQEESDQMYDLLYPLDRIFQSKL